nr:hypothetical protein [Tanacetum cinerariifolium]
MSDSKDSTITYTKVSSPFEGLSEIGSPRVEGPPMMPEDPYAYVVAAFQAPPSPDYVPGSEEPKQAQPLPEFVPDPVYLEFMPPEDEILPTKEQPLPAADSPTADSPGYISESDPEEDPNEDDEDPKEDPVNYPVDRDDDDDEEEEEHPVPADSILPPLVYRITARIADVPEVTLPPQKRLCIALGLRYKVGESSSAATIRPTGGFRADYGFVSTLDDEIRRDPKRERGRDRRDHAWTARLMETEARLSRQAWVQSMDASDTARAEVMSLRTTVLAQQSKITGLRAADRTRQT